MRQENKAISVKKFYILIFRLCVYSRQYQIFDSVSLHSQIKIVNKNRTHALTNREVISIYRKTNKHQYIISM